MKWDLMPLRYIENLTYEESSFIRKYSSLTVNKFWMIYY